MALFTEDWAGTVAGWPAQWYTVTSGTGTIVDRVSGRGRLATGTGTYGRAGAINYGTSPLSSVDYTLTVDLLLPILSEWYAYIHVRGADGLGQAYKKPSSYQIRIVGAPGGISVEFYEVNASEVETYRGAGGIVGTVAAGDTVRIKIEVSGSVSVTLKEKVWKVGTSEPAYTDLSSMVATAYTGAYIALSAQGGNNLVSEDIQWDDLDVSAIGGASTQTMTLPLVTNTETIFNATIVPPPQFPVLPLVSSSQTIYSTVVALNLLAILPVVTITPTVFAFDVVPYGHAVLPLVDAAPTVFTPQVTYSAALPLVTSTQTLFNTTITQNDPHLLPLVTSTQTIYQPTITTTKSVVMRLVSSTTTVYEPAALVAGTQSVVMDLVTSTETVFEPRQHSAIITYIFEPPHDSDGPRKLSEQGRRRAGVSRVANDLASRYAAPRSFSVLKVGSTYQTIQGPTTDQVDAADIYYAGGHIYEVDETEAAALVAAGYDVQESS